MINKKLLELAVLLCLIVNSVYAQAVSGWVDSRSQSGDFPLATQQQLASIVVASGDFKVVHLAARDLAADIARVIDRMPTVSTTMEGMNAPAVLVGTLGKSPHIDKLVAAGKLDVAELRGQWESFLIATVDAPQAGISHALVIVGSDRRGTAFGVYELSQAIGVSPWYWWADVAPEKKSALYVTGGTRRFGPPSVKYRGIFINDEDWGIHQWAAKTFEPENGGIGPKTYEKMFELMLRLKANTLWPAMHPTTKPFNNFPQNAQLADDYAIVMGSSHAEPMLRNNVGEWTAPKEHYNYLTHRNQVFGYWEERMRTNGRFENIYTTGMRGIHDSYMQGPTTDAGRIGLLQKIFADQRTLIAKYTKAPVEQVPQMFCAYKEVLGLYRQGLQVPEDVTIVWPDDNFGYMRNFANAEERKRPGGFGVYYHISYLGAPMAYLWLNTTPPALIWQEMSKSYDMGADRIWIVNVGDLKPAEIGTEFFLQMAWDINRWQRHNQADFLRDWAAREFGVGQADAIANLMRDYYQLNYQRKPEHLQWWLPRQTPVLSDMSPPEAEARLDAFYQLRLRVEKVRKKISAAKQEAFFQLVGYPINGAALANIRFIEGERGNPTAALAADAQLKKETALWDTWLAQGKWKHFMAVEPADTEWDAYRLSPWVMPAASKPVAATSAEEKILRLDAEDFTSRKAGRQSTWELIADLGHHGKGSMSLFPVTAPALTIEQWQQASRMDYQIKFSQAGEYDLHVNLLPTHPLNGNQLRFGLAVGDVAPELVALDVNDGGPEWAQGVLTNRRVVRKTLNINKPGKYELRIYGLDAGVSVDSLTIRYAKAIN